MSGIVSLSLFLTGDGAVRLINAFGNVVLIAVSCLLLLFLVKLAVDDWLSI
jgi:hypothetical protein